MRLAVRRRPDASVNDRPTVLLVHGVTASSRTWWRIGPAVARAGWQAMAVDLRCHGASGCEDVASARYHADDLYETLVTELGEARVDVAWGHSMGARAVMQLLNEHPAAATRAVLEDPPGYVSPERRRQVAAWRRETALARREQEALVSRYRRETDWDERDIVENVASLADCRVEPIIRSHDVGAREPAPELARGVRVPTLVVAAALDRGTALPEPDRSLTISRLPRGSSLVELPGGHTLHRDLPGEYLRTVLGWLAAPRPVGA